MTGLIIRDSHPEDLPFILSSWLSSHAESRCLSPNISADIYFTLHRPIVEAILARRNTYIKVAVNEEDPSLIYGYAVFEGIPAADLANVKVFHYVYVKRAFNGFGIASRLIDAAPFPMDKVYITHITHRSKQVFSKYDFTYCFYFLYPVKMSK